MGQPIDHWLAHTEFSGEAPSLALASSCNSLGGALWLLPSSHHSRKSVAAGCALKSRSILGSPTPLRKETSG